MCSHCLTKKKNMVIVNNKNMKIRFLYIALLLNLTSVVLSSCKQNDYLQVNENLASVGFVYLSYGNDSIVYSFALHPNIEEDIVKVPLKLIGFASPQDREVGVEVVENESTAKQGVDYVIERKKIEANVYKDSMIVRIKKTADVENKDLVVKFRLCGNDLFVAAPIDAETFRVILTSQLAKPTGWPFGDYSVIKHKFVIQTLGIATGYEKWSTSDMIRYKGILTQALYEYNKAHPDDPLKDENGMLITFA